MSITNSLFSNNDLGVSLAMANNIAMKNTVMSNHSTKGLVIDAASRTIFLDDIGFYNNKLAYSNAATDPSIKYF